MVFFNRLIADYSPVYYNDRWHIPRGITSLGVRAANYLFRPEIKAHDSYMAKRKRTGGASTAYKRRRPSYRRRRVTRRRTRGYGRVRRGGFNKSYQNYSKKGLIMRRRNPRISQFLNPFNRLLRRAFVKQYYVEWFKLGTTAASFASSWRTYRGNDIHQCVEGQTNTEASKIDLLGGNFNEYVVSGSQIRVKFVNHSDTVTKLIVVASLSATPPVFASWTAVMKQQNIKSCEAWHYYSGNSVRQMKMYRTTEVMKSTDLYDPSVKGIYSLNATTSPTTKWYWHVGIMTSDLNTNPSQALIKTKISYYTRLETPTTPT